MILGVVSYLKVSPHLTLRVKVVLVGRERSVGSFATIVALVFMKHLKLREL